MKKEFNRRLFLKNSIAATGGIFLTANVISCSDDDDPGIEVPSDLTNINFDQGVASFDPTTSSVIIWTRYSAAMEANLLWQISDTPTFTNVLRSGEIMATAARDHTVSIEITQLDAGSKLYYRFIQVDSSAVSVTGETITLPSEDPSQFKIAVASCANLPTGLFNVYNAMANSDADVIIHLGDYIYEYALGQYGTTDFTVSSGRAPEPNAEILSLDDYRARYRQYRSDADLQLAHQLKPFICVWDDHEITNDAFRDGAENHQPDEGDFETRKQNALQAYSEYMPLMTSDINLIYRSFQVGDLVNLMMLDTRLIGRDEQLNLNSYADANFNIDFAAFQADLTSPTRTLLGSTQRDWLLGQINGSNAEWQVLGQQVLMGRMNIPVELLTLFGVIVQEVTTTGSVSPATFGVFQATLTELVTLKARSLQGDPTLTAAEIARVNTIIPYNLDAWDGYPAEREVILSALASKKTVVLAGDTHNAWFNQITDLAGNVVANEFATSSVTSPGFEGFLGDDPAAIGAFEAAITLLIDGLQYFDASQRGFLSVTFQAGSADAEWTFVDTITSSTFATSVGNNVTI
ncbi:MAG: alkaline phosphatase D family protein [Bacteroidota bacterium]